MRGGVVYIMSDNRSGSTLLDQLLGSHPEVFSLGEVHHLPAYATRDRSLYDPVHPLVCSCGVGLEDCPFWSEVQKCVSIPFGELAVRFVAAQIREGRAFGNLRARISRRLLRRHPGLLRSRLVSRALGGNRIATDSFAVFDAALRVSGARFVVDSSKSPFRMRMLYNAHPERMRIIRFARHYRGVVRSKMKRGLDLRTAASGWAISCARMKALTSDMLPSAVLTVRYEDLCEEAEAELRRICGFLEIDFSDAMLRRGDGVSHHLGGSPSKFDPDRREIRPDYSSRSRLSPSQESEMASIVASAAREWGYD